MPTYFNITGSQSTQNALAKPPGKTAPIAPVSGETVLSVIYKGSMALYTRGNMDNKDFKQRIDNLSQ
jgi:hypothetical protein